MYIYIYTYIKPHNSNDSAKLFVSQMKTCSSIQQKHTYSRLESTDPSFVCWWRLFTQFTLHTSVFTESTTLNAHTRTHHPNLFWHSRCTYLALFKGCTYLALFKDTLDAWDFSLTLFCNTLVVTLSDAWFRSTMCHRLDATMGHPASLTPQVTVVISDTPRLHKHMDFQVPNGQGAT